MYRRGCHDTIMMCLQNCKESDSKTKNTRFISFNCNFLGLFKTVPRYVSMILS